MKIDILASNKKTYSVVRLLEASKFLGIDCRVIHPKDLARVQARDILIIRHTGVDYCDLDLDILEGLTYEKVINPIETHRLLRDKEKQQHFFESLGLKVPARYKLEADLSSFDQITLKTIRGNGGHGIEFLETAKAFERQKEILSSADQRYFFQEYIEIKNEFKLFYNFGKRSVYNKSGGGNLKDGLELELTSDIPKFIEETFSTINNHLSFSIISLDFAESSSGEFFLIEVNSCPGFSLIDKSLECDTANEIIRHILFAQT